MWWQGAGEPVGCDQANGPGVLFCVVAAGDGVAGGDGLGVPGEGGGGGFADGVGFDIGNLLRVGDVDLAGEDPGEVFVELADESGLGAEVGGEAEAAEWEVAETPVVHGADEALDAGLAKAVDGLLGVGRRGRRSG